KEKVNTEIKRALQESGLKDDEDLSEKITAVGLKIDSNILYTVYDKKLLSDLYSVSKSSEFNEKLLWIIAIVIGLVIMYYTGILETLLGYLGIQMPKPLPVVK
ncbi:unnamed protein product, partial [marine sediment metagenome]